MSDPAAPSEPATTRRSSSTTKLTTQLDAVVACTSLHQVAISTGAVAALQPGGMLTVAESAVLPSANDVVRARLDALTVGLNEVAMRDDRRELSSLDRTRTGQSRQAKNLVSADQWHLDALQDARLAARLREWIDIKPRLV